MKAELVPENGDPPIPIVRDLTLVGRHEDCDVVVGHPSLSKRHCLLVKTDGLMVIRDLATTNGTKVKGQRVRWAALLPEDRVSFGAYKVRVYLGSDEMPSPSELRRARAGAAAGLPPGMAGRAATQKLYASSRKTELSPPSRLPGQGAPGFPEPSHDGTAAAEWEAIHGVSKGQNARSSPPPAAPGGFEIVEDSDDGPGAFPGGFELVDDEDDEIIELD